MPSKPTGQSYDHEVDAPVAVDSVHHQGHIGRMFIASYKTPDNSPLADNATLRLLLIVGRRPVHAVFAGSVGGEGEIELYEGTTSSNNGTSVPVVGMNRESGMFVPTSVAFHSNTLTAAGTLLYNAMMPGGSGPGASGNRIGTTERVNTEWLLRPETVYMLRVTNRSSANAQLSAAIQFYEEEEGQ